MGLYYEHLRDQCRRFVRSCAGIPFSSVLTFMYLADMNGSILWVANGSTKKYRSAQLVGILYVLHRFSQLLRLNMIVAINNFNSPLFNSPCLIRLA